MYIFVALAVFIFFVIFVSVANVVSEDVVTELKKINTNLEKIHKTLIDK